MAPAHLGPVRTYEVPGALALELWPVLTPYIERAARHHPFLKAEDLWLLVSRGFATIFIATGPKGVLGFAAVEVVQYPSRRVANVIFAGGAPGFLAPLIGELLEKIEAFGRAQGATSLSLTGRPGWLRLARKYGWHTRAQVLAHKELTDVGRRRDHHPDHARDPEPMGPLERVSDPGPPGPSGRL